DAQCAATSYCAVGVCQPVTGLQLGATCAGAAECASQLCVDGVCCNTACAGACNACNLAGTQGTCTNLASGATGTPTCSPNRCGGTASCRHSCNLDGDCAAGFSCVDHACGLHF